MKNPLHKRLPRQLKSEFGKYVVISKEDGKRRYQVKTAGKEDVCF